MLSVRQRRKKIFLKAGGLVLASLLSISGCSKIEVKPKGAGGNQPGANSQTQTASQPGQQQPPSLGADSVSGDWKFTFQFQNTTMSATTHLEQHGNQFTGKGLDDGTLTPFTVEQGQVGNGQIQFFKKYNGLPPVQYTGNITMVNEKDYQGPLMSGDYTTANNGKVTSNIWEARVTTVEPQAQAAPPVAQGAPNGAQPSPDAGQAPPGAPPPDAAPTPIKEWPQGKAPDLSGKWSVGYEYDFCIVHSTMYLEQDGGRITGHGVDIEMVRPDNDVVKIQKKFIVEKGWYNFPKVTIVRKYEKGKGSDENRTTTFKGKVTVVNDKDYQGPYLDGRTQGGGSWQAEQVK